MKYQKTLLMSASCFLLALLCLVVWGYQKDRDLAGRIAPEILRFHVLANSNSSSDQQIKTDLKSFLLETMQSCPASSKEELSSYINEHTEAFEEKANAYLSQKGVGYRAHIRVTQAYFPTKAQNNQADNSYEDIAPCNIEILHQNTFHHFSPFT